MKKTEAVEPPISIYKPGKAENLLVYVNPGFNAWHGHYMTQLQYLEKGAQAGLFDLIHLGHISLPEDAETHSSVIPLFDFKPEVVKYGTEEQIGHALSNFELKLRQMVVYLRAHPNAYKAVRFYQFTGHPRYSSIYEMVLGESGFSNQYIRAINNFLYREEENERDENRNAKSGNGLGASFDLKYTTPVVDSKAYLEVLDRQGVMGVSYLPFPVDGQKISRAGSRRIFRGLRSLLRPRKKLKLVYMGYPHAKWGYQDAFSLYRKVCEDLRIKDIEFQVRHQTVHSDEEGEASRAEWLNKSECLTHSEGFLSVDQYWQLLEGADIVLIPYAPEFYRIATSGVFVEAVLAGAVVIATKGTWMAQALERYDCGGSYEYGHVDQLADLLLQLRENFPEERKKVEPMRKQYQEEYSIETFSKHLFDPKDLTEDYQALLARLPERDPIYMPTRRVPKKEMMTGLARVVEIWEKDWAQCYQPRIRALKNELNNQERCFIIGNGPSLNDMDLERLKHETVFAANGFYLLYDRISWRPDFYFVEDHLVAEDRGKHIPHNDGSLKFFPIYLGYAFEKKEDVIFYNHRPRISYPHGFDFSLDASEITYTGCTVLFSCLQFAYFFGFKEIVLIGVDLEYKRPEDLTQSSEYGVPIYDMPSDDPNHFHEDYFGKGYRWHEPQEDKMAQAFQTAQTICSEQGVSIFNAGIGGNLDCFPRIEYETLFR